MGRKTNKYKNQADSAEDVYQNATKKLVKKTLLALAVIFAIILLIAIYFLNKVFYAQKTKIKNNETEIVKHYSPQVLITETTPMYIPSPTPSPTPSILLSPSPIASNTPSPSPTNTPTPQPSATDSIVLVSDKNLDGYLSSNGGGSTNGIIKIGRSGNKVERGFISFNISKLIQNNITSARLKIYQTKTRGNVFKNGNEIKIDHINYGESFENSDYGVSSLSSSFSTISNNSNREWKIITVTDQIKSDIKSGRRNSQFRLHLSNESEIDNSSVEFESADNSAGSSNLPTIEIK